MTISPTQAGRPRDPDVDRRVADAAVSLFGDAGWAGFIYLRWPTKEALLVEALRRRVGTIAEVDTGSLRADLVMLARQMLDLYLGDAGRAAMRLGLEGDLIPGLADQLRALRTSQRSGKNRSGIVLSRYAAPVLPPVPCRDPISRAAIRA